MIKEWKAFPLNSISVGNKSLVIVFLSSILLFSEKDWSILLRWNVKSTDVNTDISSWIQTYLHCLVVVNWYILKQKKMHLNNYSTPAFVYFYRNLYRYGAITYASLCGFNFEVCDVGLSHALFRHVAWSALSYTIKEMLFTWKVLSIVFQTSFL